MHQCTRQQSTNSRVPAGFITGASKLALLVCLLVGIAACGSNKGKDDLAKPAELKKFKPEYKLKTLWSRNIGSGQGKKFNRLQPAIDGEFIYVTDADGHVLALDRFTGKKAWKASVKADVTGGVSVAYGLLVLGTPDGEVIAVNRDTGETLWRVAVGGEVLAPPATDGDVVVVQTFDGKLYALDAYTGAELWHYSSQIPVLTLRGTAAPLIDLDMVYAAFANGKLIAANIDNGAVAWETRVAVAKGESEIERVVDVDGSPLLAQDAIYAVSYQGRVGAFNPANGRPLWYHQGSSYVGLAKGFGNIYYADEDGSLVALDQRSGDPRWSHDELTNRRLSAPATLGNFVVVADFEGYIHLLSQVDGSLVARKKHGSDGVRAPILSADDIFYVYGNNGRLAAYKIRD